MNNYRLIANGNEHFKKGRIYRGNITPNGRILLQNGPECLLLYHTQVFDIGEKVGNLAQELEERMGAGVAKQVPIEDQVVAPSHYADRKYQTILVMEDSMSKAEFCGYLKGNVMKYIARAGKKDEVVQELEKAKTYLTWLLEVEKTGSLQEVPEFGGK